MALVLGLIVTLPISGADMPVGISLFKAFTGLAVGFEGYLLGNPALIIGTDDVVNAIATGTGYSGVENALFYTDNCRMLYGNTQLMADEIIQNFKAMGDGKSAQLNHAGSSCRIDDPAHDQKSIPAETPSR